MYFPHSYRTLNGRIGKDDGQPIKYEYIDLKEMELYNLKDDPAETINLYANHPDIVKKIKLLADKKREEIGDDLKGITGLENRPIGTIDKNQ